MRQKCYDKWRTKPRNGSKESDKLAKRRKQGYIGRKELTCKHATKETKYYAKGKCEACYVRERRKNRAEDLEQIAAAKAHAKEEEMLFHASDCEYVRPPKQKQKKKSKADRVEHIHALDCEQKIPRYVEQTNFIKKTFDDDNIYIQLHYFNRSKHIEEDIYIAKNSNT